MEALLLDHAAHPHQVERALNLVVVVRLTPRRQPAEADATVAPVRVANVANGLPYLHHHLVPLGRQARAFGLRQTSHRHRFDIYLFVLLFRFLVQLRDVRADFAAAKRKQ